MPIRPLDKYELAAEEIGLITIYEVEYMCGTATSKIDKVIELLRKAFPDDK